MLAAEGENAIRYGRPTSQRMRAQTPPGDLTAQLKQWGSGKPADQERLMAAVQGELRRIAAAYMRRERSDHTLQPTALVNEAYLRLIKDRGCPGVATSSGLARMR
jgi:hypothetical protein